MSVKLQQLNAYLIRFDRPGFKLVFTVAEASGVVFSCPLSQHKEIHGHSILVWFDEHPGGAPVAPTTENPKPRWKASGTDIGDLTLVPSINLDVGTMVCGACGILFPCEAHPHALVKTVPPFCRWHGNIIDGRVVTVSG